MALWILPKDKVSAWVQRLQADYEVVGPVAKDGAFVFAALGRPEEGGEPLILATTLPIRNMLEAHDMLRLYEKRWAIEIGFQQIKGSFGLERFMVRAWSAVERMLNLAALAYLVLLLLLHHDEPEVQELLAQARQLLAQESVWKQVLTVGKLHEALSLAFQEDRHAWLATLG